MKLKESIYYFIAGGELCFTDTDTADCNYYKIDKKHEEVIKNLKMGNICDDKEIIIFFEENNMLEK